VVEVELVGEPGDLAGDAIRGQARHEPDHVVQRGDLPGGPVKSPGPLGQARVDDGVLQRCGLAQGGGERARAAQGEVCGVALTPTVASSGSAPTCRSSGYAARAA
jgi:hypothetical protein